MTGGVEDETESRQANIAERRIIRRRFNCTEPWVMGVELNDFSAVKLIENENLWAEKNKLFGNKVFDEYADPFIVQLSSFVEKWKKIVFSLNKTLLTRKYEMLWRIPDIILRFFSLNFHYKKFLSYSNSQQCLNPFFLLFWLVLNLWL